MIKRLKIVTIFKAVALADSSSQEHI